MIQEVLASVEARTNERMEELLPRIFEKFLERERNFCQRHDVHLMPYVAAQIRLTRAKRAFYYSDYWYPTRGGDDRAAKRYHQAEVDRDAIRRIYRSTPCMCWDPKR